MRLTKPFLAVFLLAEGYNNYQPTPLTGGGSRSSFAEIRRAKPKHFRISTFAKIDVRFQDVSDQRKNQKTMVYFFI